MMNHRIHILGASGSGTTTLASLLAKRLRMQHFDTDEYFWIKTRIPFTEKREATERVRLLSTDLNKHPSWVLSGSLCGWGNFAIPLFTTVVFLWIPHEVRMKRLQNREIDRYGLEAISPGGWFYENHREFMTWAEKYDTAGTEMRSKALHDQWLSTLPVKIIRIEQPLPILELAWGVESLLNRPGKGVESNE